MPSERGQRANAIRAGMIVLFLTILLNIVLILNLNVQLQLVVK